MVRKFWLLLAVMALTGCGGQSQSKPQAAAAEPTPVPDVYRVRFETSKGDFVVEVTKKWAPNGAERFHRLVETGFYDDCRFFRVVRDFIVQWGINGEPRTESLWRNLTFADDKVRQNNRRGTITFAMAGKNTRTTQVFINLKENFSLNASGFAPFGQVVEGMDTVVDRLYKFYGDMPPRGSGPDPTQIEMRGNSYLLSQFPRLDYIKRARFEKQ